MTSPTVVFTGSAFPVNKETLGVDWTNPVGSNEAKKWERLNDVRAKFHSVRGNYVIIKSTRSGAMFCVGEKDWAKAGGVVAGASV